MDAPSGQCRGEHDRHHAIARGILGKIGHHPRRLGHFIHQQGFKQRIVEIGQSFEQFAAIFPFENGDIR